MYKRKLPSSATKKAFKNLIADVKRANGSGAMIMGTDVALGELTGFADVTWMPNEAKDVYKRQVQTYLFTLCDYDLWRCVQYYPIG